MSSFRIAAFLFRVVLLEGVSFAQLLTAPPYSQPSTCTADAASEEVSKPVARGWMQNAARKAPFRYIHMLSHACCIAQHIPTEHVHENQMHTVWSAAHITTLFVHGTER